MSLAQRLSLLLCDEGDDGVHSVVECLTQHAKDHQSSPVAELLPFLSVVEVGDSEKETGLPTKAPCFTRNDTLVILYATTGSVTVRAKSVEGSNKTSDSQDQSNVILTADEEGTHAASIDVTENIGRTKIGVLTEQTRAEHDTYVAMQRPMRYVLLSNAPQESSTASEAGLEIVRLDTQPHRMATSNKKGQAILNRTSGALQRARDSVASAERGARNANLLESGLTDCCTWLYESIVLVEEEYANATQPPILGESLSTGSRSDSHSAFSYVDAIVRRHLSLSMLLDHIMGPTTIFAKLESLIPNKDSIARQRWEQRKAHLMVLVAKTRVEALWMQLLNTPLLTLRLTNCHRTQTLAPIAKIVHQLRASLALIFCAVPYSNQSAAAATGQVSADGSDLYSAAARQQALTSDVSIHSASAVGYKSVDYVNSLLSAPTIATAVNGGSVELLHILRTLILPAIGDDLIEKVSELLNLQKSLSLDPTDVADRDEIVGYVMPLASRPTQLASFAEARQLLLQWTGSIERIASFIVPDAALKPEQNLKLLPYDPRRTLALDGLLNPSEESKHHSSAAHHPQRFSALSETILCSPARYASDRCRDLAHFIKMAVDAGYEMLSPHSRALFGTLHRAAKSFPLLSSEHFRNWQLLVEAFDKCHALKLEIVQSVQYEDIATGEGALVVQTQRSRVQSAGRSRPATSASVNESVMSLHSVNLSAISRADGGAGAGDRSPSRRGRDADGSTLASQREGDGAAEDGGAKMDREKELEIEVAMLHEERTILSSRLSILTDELSECRALLVSLQPELAQAQRNLQLSEETNQNLAAELRAAKAALVKALAAAVPPPRKRFHDFSEDEAEPAAEIATHAVLSDDGDELTSSGESDLDAELSSLGPQEGGSGPKGKSIGSLEALEEKRRSRLESRQAVAVRNVEGIMARRHRRVQIRTGKFDAKLREEAVAFLEKKEARHRELLESTRVSGLGKLQSSLMSLSQREAERLRQEAEAQAALEAKEVEERQRQLAEEEAEKRRIEEEAEKSTQAESPSEPATAAEEKQPSNDGSAATPPASSSPPRPTSAGKGYSASETDDDISSPQRDPSRPVDPEKEYRERKRLIRELVWATMEIAVQNHETSPSRDGRSESQRDEAASQPQPPAASNAETSKRSTESPLPESLQGTPQRERPQQEADQGAHSS
jgi:hypothetical protein